MGQANSEKEAPAAVALAAARVAARGARAAPGCALAPAGPRRRGGRVFTEEDLTRRTDAMKLRTGLSITAGAALLAAVLYALVAAPGLLSDRDSLVPASAAREARR